jgi:hypothetical protein
VNEASNASDPIAAHFRLAAIRIEHPHLERRSYALLDQDQPITANSKSAVVYFLRGYGRIESPNVAHGIDNNEVVADAVHFRKLKRCQL